MQWDSIFTAAEWVTSINDTPQEHFLSSLYLHPGPGTLATVLTLVFSLHVPHLIQPAH